MYPIGQNRKMNPIDENRVNCPIDDEQLPAVVLEATADSAGEGLTVR